MSPAAGGKNTSRAGILATQDVGRSEHMRIPVKSSSDSGAKRPEVGAKRRWSEYD